MIGRVEHVKPNNPSRLFNRELSWLFFNTRVLEEAENPDVPLLERVRFLSISASNLDEFYMVRVAGLREQVRAGVKSEDPSLLSSSQQLEKIDRRAGKIVARQNRCWRKLQQEMAASDINVLRVKALSKAQTIDLRATFDTTILPLLTPLAVDPAHPFPFGKSRLWDCFAPGEDRSRSSFWFDNGAAQCSACHRNRVWRERPEFCFG